MAYNKQTFKIIANFASSHFINSGSSGVSAPAGYVSAIPALWTGNEFEIVVDCYEHYSNGDYSDFDSAATCKLYIKRNNSTEDPLTLDASGVISQIDSNYCRLTFSVDEGTLTDEYANTECLLYGVIEDTNEERTFAQVLTPINENGTEAATPESRDVDLSSEEITEDDTLSYRDGRVQYFVTSTCTVTLHAASSGVTMVYLTADSGVTITVSGTINGDAGGMTIDPLETACLLSDGTSWFNLQSAGVVVT